MNKNPIDRLMKLYSTDPSVQAVCDNLAARERNTWQPKVDVFSRQTGLHRGEVVRVFKSLEEMGFGRFLVGRRGKSSRFEWTSSPLSVAQAAAGETAEIQEVTDEERSTPDSPEESLVEHDFLLRKDLKVSFKLPVDLNPQEASRLSDFLKTLPLGEL